jgi:selenocysteine-specific elongation factor
MYVIGTAGHVDHGKSLLVEALTGIDPDRLREEKARGMTIDLGFAWLTLPSGRSVSIVDVPGHERFIKNMLAGVGGIDVALLVIAADDGVMPQTREHLAVLDLLDVRRGVVALTKCDLADDEWLALVRKEIEETLSGTTLRGAPVVRCSAVTGAGLDDLRGTLDAAVEGLAPKRDVRRPRLPIDRVFTIAGFGTVVTGTLIDGALTAGVELEALPGNRRGRVRGLQTHKDAVERALPGTRVAVNLTGIAKDDLRRGMVLTSPGWLRETLAIDARVRAVRGLRHALRHNMHVTLHAGADEANAQLRLLDCDELRAGEEAWAQIRLETPVAVVRGDRFVLRTPDDTVAGGVIVDTAPKRHRRRHGPTLDRLTTLLSNAPEDVLLQAVVAKPFVELAELVGSVSLTGDQVDAALARLVTDGRVRMFGDGAPARIATPAYVEELRAAAFDALAAYHAEHPLRGGMPQEELRRRLGIDQRALTLVVAGWPEIRVAGATASLAAHERAPSAAQRADADAYLARLRSKPESPPIEPLDAELSAYLVETGAVVDAGDGVVFDAAAFDSMERRVIDYIGAHGEITLAQVRDLFATSRKYAQALLEEMDRRRVTRRIGDARVLRLPQEESRL